jgi:hypothetical protein
MAPSAGAKWINGRHRTWGMATAGFEFAPALNASFGDDVHFWHPDPNGWPGSDPEDIDSRRRTLEWWMDPPESNILRSANPNYAGK